MCSADRGLTMLPLTGHDMACAGWLGAPHVRWARCAGVVDGVHGPTVGPVINPEGVRDLGR